MQHKSFILYNDEQDYFKQISLEERGKVITAVYEYSNGDDISVSLEGESRMLFTFIQRHINSDKARYADVCQKRAESARKKHLKDKQLYANADNCIQTDAIEGDNDIENDIDIDIDIENDTVLNKMICASTAKPTKLPPSNDEIYDKFKVIYNDLCSNLPKLTKLSERRKKDIKAFLKQLDISDFENACRIANTIPFLIGKNDRGWKATFEFIIKVDNALKIIEGNYGRLSSQTNNYNDSLDDLF